MFTIEIEQMPSGVAHVRVFVDGKDAGVLLMPHAAGVTLRARLSAAESIAELLADGFTVHAGEPAGAELVAAFAAPEAA